MYSTKALSITIHGVQSLESLHIVVWTVFCVVIFLSSQAIAVYRVMCDVLRAVFKVSVVSVLYLMCSMQYSVFCAQFAVCSMRFTVCSSEGTVLSVQFAVCSVQCAM